MIILAIRNFAPALELIRTTMMFIVLMKASIAIMIILMPPAAMELPVALATVLWPCLTIRAVVPFLWARPSAHQDPSKVAQLIRQ